jgi:hypothetical protein
VASKGKPTDLVLVHSATNDGGVNVLRARDERLEVGTMRPLEEGRPIRGEVVKLKQRPEMPNLFDVETQFVSEEAATTDTAAKARPNLPENSDSRGATGPAQVASDTYRKNWDTIWKRQRQPKRLPT